MIKLLQFIIIIFSTLLESLLQKLHFIFCYWYLLAAAILQFF